MMCFFPACQVRVVRFYVSHSSSSSCQLPMAVFPTAPQLTEPQLQASTAVVPPTPQPRACHGSVPTRTSTTSLQWQCSRPDLGPQPPAPNASPPDLNLSCQNLCQRECQNLCQIEGQKICEIEGQNLCEIECRSESMPDRRSEFMSEFMSDRFR